MSYKPGDNALRLGRLELLGDEKDVCTDLEDIDQLMRQAEQFLPV